MYLLDFLNHFLDYADMVWSVFVTTSKTHVAVAGRFQSGPDHLLRRCIDFLAAEDHDAFCSY